jgi:hypothetical protein
MRRTVEMTGHDGFERNTVPSRIAAGTSCGSV